MRNILFSSLVVMSFVAFTGCSGTDTEVKTTKCGEGKCGADKKAKKASKCGEDKDAKKCGGAE